MRDSTIPAYFWGNQLFPIYQPRTSISSVSGAIGPALPLGLGAAAGSGARTVVMHGDGGVMLHIGELASAAQHQLPVTLCVFNDGGYGILRWLQSNRYQGEYTNTDLGTVDFCKVAEGMGVPAARVRSVAEFEKAFAESLASNGPYVIDIDETAMQPVAGMLMPGQSSA